MRFLAAAAAGTALDTAQPAFAVAPKRPARPRVVMLDPGHGGVDPGCIGFSGTYEKDVTLQMVRELARALEATGRYRVKLTRDNDEFVALEERVARARAANAELLLS